MRVEDPNGEVVRRNPGDLEDPPLHVPFSFEHVHEATGAAVGSVPSWKRLKFTDRLSYLKRYHEVLKARQQWFSQFISLEVGKPLWESQQEIGHCLTHLETFLNEGELKNIYFEEPKGESGEVRFSPRGVVAILCPASLPALTAHQHLICALGYGNTVVLKPSRFTPTVGQCIAEMLHEAGIPSGVFNLIHGESEVARRLACHPGVDVVIYTGSFETGLKIKKQVLSDHGKTVILELSGKNGGIVWEDCEYSKALHESIYSAFLTTGQRLLCTDRILIHEKLFDRFVSDFHQLAKKCRIGYAFAGGDKAPFMGPLVSESVMESYLRYQGIAVREGCEEIMRGKPLEKEMKGYYVSPSIHVVTHPDAKSVYQKQPIVGPNVALYRVKDLEEAGDILRHTHHGLVTTLYSRSRENYTRLPEAVKTGLFYWNRPTVDPIFYAGLRSVDIRPMGIFSFQYTDPVSLVANTDPKESVLLPGELPRLDD